MVPAAVMGMDVKKFLDRTKEMVSACAPSASVEANPGAMLGIVWERPRKRPRQSNDCDITRHLRLRGLAGTVAGEST